MVNLKILKNNKKTRIFYPLSALLFFFSSTKASANRMATAAGPDSTKTFETLKFDNLALRSLPLDSIKENYVRQVSNACFSKVNGISKS